MSSWCRTRASHERAEPGRAVTTHKQKHDASHNRRWHDLVWSTVGNVAAHVPFTARTFEMAGHVASYSSWRAAHGLETRCFRTRRDLWRRTAWDDIQAGATTVLEFGVASGEMTRSWLEAVPNPQLRWHGFDTFTGLPAPWTRGGLTVMNMGTFDRGGSPPQIDDARVTWHRGRIEHTIDQVPHALRPGRVVALFDLVLYAPSKVALDWLTPRLAPGDLLYFDEAFDPAHERRLLDEWISGGVSVRPRGCTGMALMVEYVGQGR